MKNPNTTVNVTFSPNLIQILTLDEKDQVLHTRLWKEYVRLTLLLVVQITRDNLPFLNVHLDKGRGDKNLRTNPGFYWAGEGGVSSKTGKEHSDSCLSGLGSDSGCDHFQSKFWRRRENISISELCKFCGHVFLDGDLFGYAWELLLQRWRNEIMRWNPEEFGGCTVVRLSHEQVWVPDVVLWNK